MLKIIAVMDGLRLSKSTVQYAIQVARQSKAHLTGVFLDDAARTGYRVFDLLKEDAGLIGSAKKKWDRKDARSRAQAAAFFEESCREAGQEFTVHHDKGYALRELQTESIYADLMIVDVRETLQRHSERPPTRFIRDLLSKVHCPVLVVPHIFKPVDRLLMLYDGRPASVQAMRMFGYTMPGLLSFPALTLFVNWKGGNNHLPENHLVKELMKRHLPQSEYAVLQGDPEAEILSWLAKQGEGSLVVLGAYDRGIISRWFKPSLADILMKELKLPLFIAH